MSQDLTRVTRILRKPVGLIAKRMATEMVVQADRFLSPRRTKALDLPSLLAATEAPTLHDLWSRLAGRVYAIPTVRMTEFEYERSCPGDLDRIVDAAAAAIARRVNVLGSGPICLGQPIDWHKDFKTGVSWPVAFMRDIDYTNLDRPSDVKFPWEVSRLQWLIPVGQAYVLTRDERYANAAREIIDEWIAGNPYARGVNWACTMEVAMRIFSWTWFFHVFARSRAWSDEGFQLRFLRMLFLHGEFTERYLERSDINGNHFTADAAGMVFAGLFFGRGAAPCRWAEEGWRLLDRELPLQVFSDGVNFEASIAYHRLVLELFFFAARYREALGLPVPDHYRIRLLGMARFAQKYTRPDGTTPLLGDADDARVLPFGGQAIGDHRYLAALVGAHWHADGLTDGFSGPRSEIVWALGRRAAALMDHVPAPRTLQSAAFSEGGCYVMRNDRDHVFIDCGPVGQRGRGGHGHNDCLSFEAALDGVHLVCDCGAYVYTASARERNFFRSTASHNTPQVDAEELNRFIRWDYLWTLHDDAKPEVRTWEPGAAADVFTGSHSGYQRLAAAVRPVRTITLDHVRHALTIHDTIEGAGEHLVTIPLHLAPGVTPRIGEAGRVLLEANGREFEIAWAGRDGWSVAIEPARVSPSYGVVVPAARLVWSRRGALPATLTLSLSAVRVVKTEPQPVLGATA